MQNKLHGLNLYINFYIANKLLLPFVTFKLKVTASLVVWYFQQEMHNGLMRGTILLLLVKVTADLIIWKEILRKIFFLHSAMFYNHGQFYHI